MWFVLEIDYLFSRFAPYAVDVMFFKMFQERFAITISESILFLKGCVCDVSKHKRRYSQIHILIFINTPTPIGVSYNTLIVYGIKIIPT